MYRSLLVLATLVFAAVEAGKSFALDLKRVKHNPAAKHGKFLRGNRTMMSKVGATAYTGVSLKKAIIIIVCFRITKTITLWSLLVPGKCLREVNYFGQE
jgi:hypothetical protein